MSHYLLFSRNRRAWMDLPIRAFEGGDAGHVGIQIGDEVIDSAFWQRGVRKTSFEAWRSEHVIVGSVPVYLPKMDEANAWLHEQLGKPYDWTAILGFLAWRDWSEPESWYCSELAAGWMQQGGVSPWVRSGRIGVRMVRAVALSRMAASFEPLR